MIISKIHKLIKKVKNCSTQILQRDSVHPLSLFRYCVDAVICHKLYGSSIDDYFELRFFEKTHNERKTYFTTNDALSFINCINGLENNRRFYEKTYMYQVLGKYTKREQLLCPPKDFKEFESFILRHRKVFYKPSNAYCGNGVEVWCTDDSDIKELYEVVSKRAAVLDEPVTQHPYLASLNPDSLNSVKIYTMMIKNECHFVAAELRIGRRGSFVDNYERGGLAACVDITTGAIIGKAYDIRMNQYQEHPDTGVKISGLILPNWSELLRFTEECAHSCPLAYVEWDIAIRENDCVLIEANANARNSEIQMGVFQGRKKQFQELKKLYFQSIA